MVHEVAVCINEDSSFSGQRNPAVVCGIVFDSTAGSFLSEAPQIVEVAGAVNLAAEHCQAGGGCPAARHERGAAHWGVNRSLAGCESPTLPSCSWHVLPLGMHTEASRRTESCRCHLLSQP